MKPRGLRRRVEGYEESEAGPALSGYAGGDPRGISLAPEEGEEIGSELLGRRGRRREGRGGGGGFKGERKREFGERWQRGRERGREG